MKSKDNSKQRVRSIFPDIMKVEGATKNFNILDEIEILSSRADIENSRFLNRENLENRDSAKNSIVDLIKAGYELPNVDAPERMLLEDAVSSKTRNEEKRQEDSPYRMVNLISKNFRLPEVDDDGFFR